MRILQIFVLISIKNKMNKLLLILLISLGLKYTPDLVLHLKKIHQSNLEDAEEYKLTEIE